MNLKLLVAISSLVVGLAQAAELRDFEGTFKLVDARVTKNELLCKNNFSLRLSSFRPDQLLISSYNNNRSAFQTYLSTKWEFNAFYFSGKQIATLTGNSVTQKVYNSDDSSEAYELKLSLGTTSAEVRLLTVEFKNMETGIVETQCDFEAQI
jgi:hypothetical protein